MATKAGDSSIVRLRGPVIKDFVVSDWHPTQDGSGPATAVAIVITLESGHNLVLRLKSADAVDRVIAAMLESKQRVFGDTRS